MAIVTCAEGSEVLGRLGHDVAEQLDHNPADGLIIDLDIHVDNGPDLRLDLVKEREPRGHGLPA